MIQKMPGKVDRVPVFRSGGEVIEWVLPSMTALNASKVAGAPVSWARHPFGMYGWRTASWKTLVLVGAKPAGIPVGAQLVK